MSTNYSSQFLDLDREEKIRIKVSKDISYNEKNCEVFIGPNIRF